jgi:hypothetical protein
MCATKIVTCAAQGQKGGSRLRKAAPQLRQRHIGLRRFPQSRLTEVFDALFEFFVVPVDLLFQRVEGFVRFRGEFPELLAEFTQYMQGMVDRFSHGKSSVPMTKHRLYL